MKFPFPVEPVMRGNLVAVIEALARANGFKARTICRKVANDDRFLLRLTKEKRSVTARVYDQVIARCAAIWPDGLEWPSDIQRPEPDYIDKILRKKGGK